MTKFSHVLVLFGLPLLLCQCTEREDAAQKPPTLQELYSAAANGDNAAFTALLRCNGSTAGQLQEKLGDTLAYRNTDKAEECWAAAKANGIKNGGPDEPVYYFFRRHWFTAGVLPLLLLIAYVKLRFFPKKKQTFGKKGATAPLPHGSILLIDTNVWMDAALNSWFANLAKNVKRHQWSIHLESIVLGELKGLSKNQDKAQAAHLGMKRVEQLQNSLGKAFRLEDHASRKTDLTADSVLLRIAAKNSKYILITNDRELRILAKDKGVLALRSAECGL